MYHLNNIILILFTYDNSYNGYIGNKKAKVYISLPLLFQMLYNCYFFDDAILNKFLPIVI